MKLKKTLCSLIASALLPGCVNFNHNSECDLIKRRAIERLKLKEGYVIEGKEGKEGKGGYAFGKTGYTLEGREGYIIESKEPIRKHNKKEKLLLGAMIAAQFADYYTTKRALDARASEMNPILGKSPSNDNIAFFKLGVTLLFYWAGQENPESREGIYLLGTIPSGIAAGLNNHVYHKHK